MKRGILEVLRLQVEESRSREESRVGDEDVRKVIHSSKLLVEVR